MKPITIFIPVCLFLAACNAPDSKTTSMESPAYTTFAEDVEFLNQYTDIIVLGESSGKGKIAVSGALQGRVMTSTAAGGKGRSYGWINRDLFASGDTLEHMNAFGGEERFWLGPEGGQFSVFFEKGASFTLEDWQTPRLIDLEPFDLVEKSAVGAHFSKTASLTNYSGFSFDFRIDRKVSLIIGGEIPGEFGLDGNSEIDIIGYETENTLTNTGDTAWEKETGLLSIWLLGMFNPSPATTIIIPYETGEESDLGPVVNDTYFGKVPEERLVAREGVIYFRGDGEYRSKIGLLPARAKDVLGAYDADNQILTIVKYSKPEGITDYVNSLWEIQDAPFGGDVVNSYNDGPPEPGAKPLGPFFELETSSPALALAPGESGTHTQATFHLEGNESTLAAIARRILGVELEEVKTVFSH